MHVSWMLPPADCVARCLRRDIKDGGAPASPQRDGSPNEKISRARRPRGKLEKCVNMHVLTQDRHIPFLSLFFFSCKCVRVGAPGADEMTECLGDSNVFSAPENRPRLSTAICFGSEQVGDDDTLSSIDSTCGKLPSIKHPIAVHSFWFQSFTFHRLHHYTSHTYSRREKRGGQQRSFQMEMFHLKKKQNNTGRRSYHSRYLWHTFEAVNKTGLNAAFP